MRKHLVGNTLDVLLLYVGNTRHVETLIALIAYIDFSSLLAHRTQRDWSQSNFFVVTLCDVVVDFSRRRF